MPMNQKNCKFQSTNVFFQEYADNIFISPERKNG